MEDLSFQTHPNHFAFCFRKQFKYFHKLLVTVIQALLCDNIMLLSLTYLRSFPFPLYFERNQNDFQC